MDGISPHSRGTAAIAPNIIYVLDREVSNTRRGKSPSVFFLMSEENVLRGLLQSYISFARFDTFMHILITVRRMEV